jgi:acyl-CoA reductase-like NAD-dependent aldehyde dehydrogenase
MSETYKLLIDGRRVDGISEFPVINPATGLAFASAPKADEKQVDAAINAAGNAFKHWSATSFAVRSAALIAIADELAERSAEFARTLTLEQGKPLESAAAEIGYAVAMLRGFAKFELQPKVLRDQDEVRITEHRFPLGVVAAITPWNYPVSLLMGKVGPALVSGNTLVIKPAPTTPLTTLMFGELCSHYLPPGVLNVIADEGDMGDYLTSHPGIAKISLTGSTATGKRVMANASSTLKRLTLELGGNDAALVLDDIAAEEVAPALFRGAMMNSGQVCLAIKRAYVPDAIYDDVCDELSRLADEAIVGDGLEQGTQYGPLQNSKQFERVQGFLEEAARCGSVVSGGEVLDRPGFFVRPTIVRDIADDTRLVREEQFGPILPVLRYTDIEEALHRINDTPYGLGGTVWTSDPGKGEHLAARIEAGVVWVNKHLDIPIDLPLRAAKQSGMGTKYGLEGVEDYTQAVLVNVKK